MLKKKGIFSASVITPIAVGILFLFALFILNDADEANVEAAEFYEFKSIDLEKTKGPFQGTLNNGTYVTIDDVINITAENESTPNDSTDKLKIDLYVSEFGIEKYNVSFNLTYLGIGEDFWGKIELKDDLLTDHQMNGNILQLNVSNDCKIEIMKHKGDEGFFHFFVDSSKPLIIPVEPYSFVSRLKGTNYATTDARINIIYQDSDPESTAVWAINNGKVKYRWDSNSEQTWDGTDFAIPASIGTHVLNINATDRFDQYGNTTIIYQVTDTNTDSEITNAVTYVNKTVMSSTVRIKDGGSLDLINTTFILTDQGAQLIVYEDSYLNITGPGNSSNPNNSMLYSSSGMIFRALENSHVHIEDTDIEDSSTSPITPTMELYTGDITNSTIKGPNDLVIVRNIGVSIENTSFTGVDADHGLIIDINHTFESSSTEIVNTIFNGSFKKPVRVVNNSIWKPYDVGKVYTLGTGVFSLETVLPDLTGVSDPAIYIPHFIDQRDGTSKFNISYKDGNQWYDLVSYTDQRFQEWSNGEDAMIGVGSLPSSAPLRMIWNNSDGTGSFYYGIPKLVGSNGIAPTLFSFLGPWDDTTANVPTLEIHNITLEDAKMTFVDIESSGLVNISGLSTSSDKELGAQYQVMVKDGEVVLSDAELEGDSDLIAFIKADLGSKNDFPVQEIMDVSMEAPGEEVYAGIQLRMTWGNLSDIEIRNVSYGIDSEDSFMNFDDVDVEPSDFGVYMDLPSTNADDVEMELFKLLVSGNVQYSGFYLHGTTDYELDITLGGFDISSEYNDTYDRTDGYGLLTIDVDSTEEDMINIYGRVDTGPGHGIAIGSWSANGEILMNETFVSNVALDGVWLNSPVLVQMEGVDLSLNDGWGFYGYEQARINITGVGSTNSRFFNNEIGGLMIMNRTSLNMENTDITQNGDYSVWMGNYVTAEIRNVDSSFNTYGISIGSYCEVSFISSSVDHTARGSGLVVEDSDVVISGSSQERSSFSNNNGHGLFMDGGTLEIQYLDASANGGDGISLFGVDLRELEFITTSFNQEAGFEAHVDDTSLLDMNDQYIAISNMKAEGNWGPGITFTIDPTSINRAIEIELETFQAYGNRQGDVSGTRMVHFTWNFIGTGNKLGDANYYGYTVASIDFVSNEGGLGSITNENLTFLNDEASFMINEGGNLKISDSYIRPQNPNHVWTINAKEGSSIEVSGSYLGYMGMFEIDDAREVALSGSQLSYGTNGLKIIGSDGFEINSCQFTKINGFALNLENIENGTIRGTGFRDNLRGIVINGINNRGSLVVDDSGFMDNSWGMYIFTAHRNSSIMVKNSEFDGNGLAPIWLSNTNITLQNTDIDPDAIIVNDLGYEANIYYTLTVSVINENEEGQIFDIEVKIGSPASNIIANGLDSSWSRLFRSYTVTNDGVDSSREDLRISIKYEESTGSNVKYGYIFDTITLNTRTHRIYSGFEAPTTTGEFLNDLEAFEDIGLRDGPVDISTWFTDIGRDKGNLTYSVHTIDPEIEPILTGTVLSIDLQKDWNGNGKFGITVEDPHGKKLTVEVLVNVIPRNDVPVITDPRIVTVGGEDDVPRSGDTIEAVWTWMDIDEGDEEPTLKYIRWYLNGTLIQKYEGKDIRNSTTITNVRSRQVWSYKVWPMDFYSLNYKEYGEPVMSPIAVVQNVGPRWTSNLTYNVKNPTTDMDIIVSPGTFDDPDSSVVTYHYLWEVRWGDKYVPLGAPDSPILDSRFTSKNDDIRVRAWISDGDSTSDIRTATFTVRNSKPEILSVTVPRTINEKDTIITVTDFETYDADGDRVTLYYYWNVGGSPIAVTPEIPQLSKVSGGWSYPGRANITLTILPFDSENVAGDSLVINIQFEPTDTDGDGIYDDKNGNGINEEGDDKDDDNDGFEDAWEIFMGSDPKNAPIRPLDTDGDGRPDGNPGNTEIWMDTDDDEDGIVDEGDSYPTNGALPGDLDRDGIGNDRDNDIDGDGVPNDQDYDPYNPQVTSAPEEPLNLDGFILFLIIIIILGIIIIGVLIYMGIIKLPSSAPPPVADEGAEAIFEEDEERPSKGRKKEEELEELEDIDNMSVCSVCGEIVSMDLDKCSNCGAVFEDAEDEEMVEFEEEFEEDED